MENNKCSKIGKYKRVAGWVAGGWDDYETSEPMDHS
jgi:hypothetical protein